MKKSELRKLIKEEIQNYFPPKDWKPEGWSKELYSDGYRYFDENGKSVNYDDLLKIWHKQNNINY